MDGIDVDGSLIPLPCGGHISPPGDGLQYHYHKAADCEHIQEPGEHGPLIGYAADGFGIYGFGDYWGMPVLDECHGHFGVVPDSNVCCRYWKLPFLINNSVLMNRVWLDQLV